MQINTRKNTGVCISCDRTIDVGNHPEIGKFLVCEHCETELEIVALNPIVLDWAYYGEDDYDDDEYEDDDYDFDDDDY